MKLDQAAIEEYGTFLLKLRMFPYFDMANYIIMCLHVREDIHQVNAGVPNFHKRHPLAVFFSCMLMCFGGGMLAHFLLGEPILDDFKTHQSFVLASACWYLVFYSPFDVFYKLVKFLPIKILISCGKEFVRCRKIYDGVNHAMHVYPNSYIIIVLVATAKGAGTGFLSIIDRFTRGAWVPNTSEIMHPSVASKSTFIASILFLLQRKELISVPRSVLFFCAVIFFSYVKVMSIFFKTFDPFFPFENLTAAVFFGGILDALRKAMQKPQQPTQQRGAKGGIQQSESGGQEANKLSETESKKTN